MSIEELVHIVPPPEQPVHGRGVECCDTKDSIGLQLPDDFLDLSGIYGAGVFRNEYVEVWLANPFSGVACADEAKVESRNLQGKRDRGDDIPYPLYPEANGLFLFGGDNNGSCLYWLTRADIDPWPILTRPHEYCGPEDFEQFNLPMTTFLARAFSGEMRVDIWSDTELKGGPSYFSYPDRAAVFVPYSRWTVR